MTSRVYSLVKSIVSWTIATVVVCAGIATVYYIYRGNEELRARVELELAKAYPNETVTVGSARFLQGEGLQLREVSVVQPSSGRSSRVELAYVHEATLYCTPTLEQLMKGKVNIQRVSIRGLSLFPQRFRDGSWNVASLIPVKQADHRMPIIAIEDAQIQVSDHTGTRTNVTVFRDIQATITPPHLNPKRDGAVAIEAKFANEHVKSIDLTASVDPNSLAWAIEGEARGLIANANLFRRLLPQHMTPSPQRSEAARVHIDGQRISRRARSLDFQLQRTQMNSSRNFTSWEFLPMDASTLRGSWQIRLPTSPQSHSK